MVTLSLLPAIAPAVPLLLAAAWTIPRLRPLAVAAAPAAAVPALVVAALPLDPAGVAFPTFYLGATLGLDWIGRAFLFFTAALWTAAGVYARGYVTGARRDAFFGLHLLTLGGNLTLIVAWDILTFYLGFAVMTFAAYGLVVHGRGAAALRAGRIYVVMALAGEACLLAGIMVVGAGAPSWLLGDVGQAYAAATHPGLLAGLFLVGFGVKAGLVPLHMWLPLAHPIAPVPASALLSGTMIKAGLLGWIRFLPLETMALPGWGAALVAAGVAAAFYGVVAGFAQDDSKTVLAYSSVSQMGFMAVGVGIALVSPPLAPLAVLAVGHYAAHHAAAKAGLFLSVGIAPCPPHAIWRQRVILGAAALLALTLAGAPFTSGSVAKSALKQAGQALPGEWPAVLAVVLGLAAAGTTALLARFLVVLPVRASQDRPACDRPGPWLGWAAVVLFSTTAPLWLAWAQPPPPGVTEPDPVLGLADSLWPIGVGLVFVVAVLRFGHRLPRLGKLRVPPGDLIVPLERGVALLARPSAPRPPPAVVSRLRGLRDRGRSRFGAATRIAAGTDARLGSGLGFGLAILLALVLLGLGLVLW